MASSGKKGKKSKGKTVPLTDFLQESSGIASVPVKKFNWSDEVEDALESGGYESRPKATNVFLPTAPRAARGPDISDDRIPNKPPFIAYISNLPYDVDEEEIIEFFSNFMVCSLRLPRDDRGGEGGRLKGFGYVEFEDRATLIEAISIGDTNMKGRRIKIDVAASSDADRRRGGRMDMGRDRPERPEVSMGDWRSGPRTDPAPESRGGGGGGGFNRDRSDRDRDREGAPDTNRAGAWRDSTDRPSFRDNDRDRGFSRDGDRSERSFNRDGDRDRGGGGGYRDGGGFSDRGRYGDRDRDGDRRGGGFGSRRYGGDREGYDRERGESDFRRGPREDSAPSERDQPRSRPKLNLAPRTKPIEEQAPLPSADEQEEQASAAPAPAPVPAASIFGAAKPVDTSARERQIEERLEKEKEVRPAARDSSRDNKSRDDDEERPPKREAWGRKRNDDQEEAAPRKESPERRPSSRGPPPARRDEKKTAAPRDRAPPRKEEKPPARKEEKVPRDNHDREMPKLKEPEPPNFAQSNIFASLEAEGEVSD
ncbi:eukaryotic translation initiation factor 4B [Carabus blaptoides fortunei]